MCAVSQEDSQPPLVARWTLTGTALNSAVGSPKCPGTDSDHSPVSFTQQHHNRDVNLRLLLVLRVFGFINKCLMNCSR